MLVDKLVNDNIRTLTPYQSARRLFSGEHQGDWLNANESPYANEYQLDSGLLNRYPDCQPPAVINAYSGYSGVKAQQTLVTRGADEGIELLIRAFCTPGKDSVLICPPTYGMYAISAETCDVGVKKAPLQQDFGLDVEQILSYQGKVKLVFICSPNNPTGTFAEQQKVERILNAFADSALVVVDEAYIEFVGSSPWADKLSQYPNLVILRTLSKAFALAGIRCGFTLASEDVITTLLKVIAPYPIPAPVAQIAAQALTEQGIRRCQQQVEALNQQRLWLTEQLNRIPQVGLVCDSQANFLLIRSCEYQALMQALVSQGIIIRDQSRQPQLENCLRISVGSPEQNQRLMDAIQHFFAQQEAQA